jgi:hypothetical protein
MERRLDRLDVIYRRDRGVGGAAPPLDFSGLTPQEQWELDALLTAPAAHQRRFGVASYAMLTARERERLDALLARVKEAT